jgi:hypothetical protein
VFVPRLFTRDSPCDRQHPTAPATDRDALTVGLALLVRGRAVRAGHAAGAVFQFALVPSGPWGVINLGLAAVHAASVRASYPASAVDLVCRRSSGRGPLPDGNTR